jgi:hypothetical protein
MASVSLGDWIPRAFPLYTCPGTVLMAGPEPIGDSGRYIEGTHWVSSQITTLIMGTKIVLETSVSTCNQLTRLCAREDFIEVIYCVIFEDLTAAKMSMLLFWVVTSCGHVVRYQHCRGTHCLLQGSMFLLNVGI